MALERFEALLLHTHELCLYASTSLQAMAKAERAVSFHRKLIVQEIVQLTSEQEDRFCTCEEMLDIGALSTLLLDVFAGSLIHFPSFAARAALVSGLPSAQAGREQSKPQAGVRVPLDVLALIVDEVEASQEGLKRTPACVQWRFATRPFIPSRSQGFSAKCSLAPLRSSCALPTCLIFSLREHRRLSGNCS